MTIGQRIRQKRKENGLTLKLLAEQCHISISFLCDIEQNRRRPSWDRLTDIARVLGVPVSYLLGEETESEAAAYPFYSYEHRSAEFREVLEKIGDFDSWKPEDKQELLMYLTVKKKLRSAARPKKRRK